MTDPGFQRRMQVHENFGTTHDQAVKRARDWMPVNQAGRSVMCADCGSIYAGTKEAHRFHLRRRHGINLVIAADRENITV